MDGDELDAYMAVELKKARRETLLEAAKAVCDGCYSGIPLVSKDDWMYHEYDYKGATIPFKSYERCEAVGIHKLIAADQGD